MQQVEKTERLGHEDSENACVGFGQCIGMRKTQQDSAGITSNGAFAVISDGMGGLADGEIASDVVVRSILEYVNALSGILDITVLLQAIPHVNASINAVLGSNGIYQSGATMVCSYLSGRRLSWISVGDSRIYLFRSGGLIQMNREHNLRSKQLQQLAQGFLSPAEMGPQESMGNLTSFFGMGNLAAVDFSAEPVTLCAGDWVILMSDGVYHFLTEAEILQALWEGKTPQAACDSVLKKIRDKGHPYQDNASIIIQAV